MNEKLICFGNLKGDIFGGITAGIVALALAFGVQSGLGAAAGVYWAILLEFAGRYSRRNRKLNQRS